MERQKRALASTVNELYKDIVIHGANMPNAMLYSITKEMADKFGAATIVKYFEDLLPDPAVARNPKLLARFGGNTQAAKDAYDAAVTAVRTRIKSSFEFVELEKLEDLAP
jgi:hypothetical protein